MHRHSVHVPPQFYTVTARDKDGMTEYVGRLAYSPEEAIAIVHRTMPRQSWWDGATWTATAEGE